MNKMISIQYLKNEHKNKENNNNEIEDKKIFNPFKNVKKEDNLNNEEEDIGMCKLILRKLIKDFTYERVLSAIPKQNKYKNSLLERPLDSLTKQYKIDIINKAMKELELEIKKENIK